MDCRTAQILMELFRPGTAELEPSEAEALDRHLADCPACAQNAGHERQSDDQLKTAMRNVSIPAGLPGRLSARLDAMQVAEKRRRLRRIAGSLAAAAAVLLAVFLGMDWQRKHPPAVDLDDLRSCFNAEVANPSEGVQKWLQENKLRTPPPEDFEYHFLAHYYLADLQGKRVPLLLFVRAKDASSPDQARVYLLSAEQFDLNALALNSQDVESVGCKVEVLFHPTDRRYAYLVVYTGDSLEPFLKSVRQAEI